VASFTVRLDKMDRRKRILLVDDDQDVLELLEYNLINHGYRVKCVPEATVVLDEACKFSPDLVVLDIMMPHANGIEVCRLLRGLDRFQSVPVFFLTAKTESSLFQLALESGGDDLIHKMMGLRSLITKIDSVLKEGWVIRKRMERLSLGMLVLDRKTSSVEVGKRHVQLSINEFELLYLLVQNPTKTITSQSIKNHIWGSDIFHVASPIDDLTERISKKLGIKWITETEENHYRLNAKVL
jgi:two-component system, OmpR family, alkaline phosphatase synthesis response regulator PhoP